MLDINIKLPRISTNFVLNKSMTKALEDRSEEISEQAANITLTADHGFEIAKNVFEASKSLDCSNAEPLRFSIEKDLYEIKFNSDAKAKLKKIKETLSNLSTLYHRQAKSKLKTNDDGKTQITLGKIDAKHNIYLSINGRLSNNSGRPYANDLLKLTYEGKELTELMFASIDKANRLHNRGNSKSFFVNFNSGEMAYGSYRNDKKDGVFAVVDSNNNLSLINFQDGNELGDKLSLTANGLLILDKQDNEGQIVLFPNEDIFQGQIDEQGQVGQGVVVTKTGTCLVGDFSQNQTIETLKTPNLIAHGKFDQDLYLQGKGSKIFPATEKVAYAAELEANWGDVLATEMDVKASYANGLVYEGKLVVKPDTETIFFDDAYLLGDVIPSGKAKLSLEKGGKDVLTCEAEFDSQGLLQNAEGQFGYKGTSYDFSIQDGILNSTSKLNFASKNLSKVNFMDLYSEIQSAIIPDYIEKGNTRVYPVNLQLEAEAGWQNDRPCDGSLKLSSLGLKEAVLKISDNSIASQAKVVNLRLANGYRYTGSVKISSIVDDSRTPNFEELLAKQYKFSPNGEGELDTGGMKLKATWSTLKDALKPSGDVLYSSRKGKLTTTIEEGKIKNGIVKVKNWLLHDGKYTGKAKADPQIDLLTTRPEIIPHDAKGTFFAKAFSFYGAWDQGAMTSGNVTKKGQHETEEAYAIRDSKLESLTTNNKIMLTNTEASQLLKAFKSARSQLKNKDRDTLSQMKSFLQKAQPKDKAFMGALIDQRVRSLDTGESQQSNTGKSLADIMEDYSAMLNQIPQSEINKALSSISDAQAIFGALKREGNIEAIIKLFFGSNTKYQYDSHKDLASKKIGDIVNLTDFVTGEEKLKSAILEINEKSEQFTTFLEQNIESFFNGVGDQLFYRKVYIPSTKIPKTMAGSPRDLPNMQEVLVETIRYDRKVIESKGNKFLAAVMASPFHSSNPAINFQCDHEFYLGPIVDGLPDTYRKQSNELSMAFKIRPSLNGSLRPQMRMSQYKRGELHGRTVALYGAESINSLINRSYLVETTANKGILDPNLQCFFGTGAFELRLKEEG